MTNQEVAQKLRILRIEKENNELHLQLARYKKASEEQDHIIAGLYISLYPEIGSFDIRDLSDYGRGVDPGDFISGKMDHEILAKAEHEAYGFSAMLTMPEEKGCDIDEATETII